MNQLLNEGEIVPSEDLSQTATVEQSSSQNDTEEELENKDEIRDLLDMEQAN